MSDQTPPPDGYDYGPQDESDYPPPGGYPNQGGYQQQGYPQQGYPQQGGYGQPYGAYGPYSHLAPHRGTLILVFGILSWVTCFIFGIIAWSMGNSDLREIEAGRMDPSGHGLVSAGRIVGMINVIVAIVGLVIGILMFLAMGLSTAHF